MESLKDLLPVIPTKASKGKTNKFWLISEKIANVTGTKPNRWLRLVKKNQHACERALDNLKELQPRNPVAYFLWLTHHYTKK